MLKLFAMIASAFLVTASPAIPYTGGFYYVPPNDTKLFDMVYNSFGLTAPAIDEVVTRAEAYWDLYRTALGTGFDAFKEKLTGVFEKAKTSRTITIDSDLRGSLLVGMKRALTSGIPVIGDSLPVKDFSGFLQLLQDGYNAPAGVTVNLLSDVAARNGALDGDARAILVYFPNYNEGYVCIVPYSVVPEITTGSAGAVTTKTVSLPGMGSQVSWIWWASNGYTTINKYYNPNTWSSNPVAVDLGAVQADIYPVAAQNSDVESRIQSETLVPITADTVIDNGIIDDTKPVVIRLPAVLPIPAETVSDLPLVQDDLLVVPYSDNPAQTVQTLSDSLAQTLGNTGDYAIDLTEYFPFCIPFDLYRLLSIFNAEPEAPVFDLPFVTGYDTETGLVIDEFTFDLSILDPVAVWVRRGSCVLFVIGLAMVTREKFLRG